LFKETYHTQDEGMKKITEIKYSFAKDAEIMDRESEELKAYKRLFEDEVIPEMKEVECRKTKAIEQAYKICICGHLTLKIYLTHPAFVATSAE
jgi:hypothetical protein